MFKLIFCMIFIKQNRLAEAASGTGAVVFENAALQEERFALLSPQAMCPGLNKSDYAGVFHAAKMSNLSFDLLTNTGLIFNFLDVFESLVSLTTVAKSPQACVSQLAHGLQVVSDIEKATHGAAGKSMGCRNKNHLFRLIIFVLGFIFANLTSKPSK